MSNITPPGEEILGELGIDSASIKFIKPHWKRTHYRAVVNWLTKYKPKSDGSNLEKVQGLLEAFHHLCEVEDWNAASQILFIELNTPTKDELHNQLDIWGYYCEQTEIYSRILGKLDSILNALFLNSLGNAYQALGEYEKAMEYYQESLAFWQAIQESYGEGMALGNLGNAYLLTNEYTKAIKCYQKSLYISREVQNRRQEGVALVQLGNFYQAQGDHDLAKDGGDRRFSTGLCCTKRSC